MSDRSTVDYGAYMPARRYMDCTSQEYDLKSAASEAEKGSAESDPDAQYLLALFLLTGSGGCEVDEKTAMDLLEMASAAGSKQAAILKAEISDNDPEDQKDMIRLRFLGEQRDTDACSELFSLYDVGKKE